MKTLRTWSWLLLPLLACGPDAVSEQPTHFLTLAQPAGAGVTTFAPSRVSMLFSVETDQGAPVAGLDATKFDLFEDGQAVSSWESQRTVQPRGERYRLNSVVLLDLSGSVLRSGAFPSLAEAARQYLKTVLGARDDGQRVALVAFDGRAAPQVVVDFTGDLATAEAGLDSLNMQECRANADCAGFSDRRTCAGWRCVDDSTNLNGAIVAGLSMLDARAAAEPAISWRDSALIVFTDGSDEAARVSSQDALQATIGSSSHVFTVGLGGDVDEQALRAFGKDGYFPASSEGDLAQAFTGIAQRVTGLANRFYVLDYCSPRRNGAHTLKIVAHATSSTGAELVGGLSADFDATGFASGCQL
jgi:hypothetical protein